MGPRKSGYEARDDRQKRGSCPCILLDHQHVYFLLSKDPRQQGEVLRRDNNPQKERESLPKKGSLMKMHQRTCKDLLFAMWSLLFSAEHSQQEILLITKYTPI